MKVKDMALSERPREKLIKLGVDCLSNEELLAIILKSGTKNRPVFELSKEILSSIESIKNLKECDYNFLLNIKGIGSAKATEVIASIELGKRIYLMDKIKIIKIHSSKDVYKAMQYYLADKKQEYFYALYLNNKNEIIERKLLFMGTVNKSLVHPREVFKYAYLTSASAIICVHNHPSGDITPSREDINLTKALIEISKVQAIPIIDHIIIGNNNYYSMADNMEMFL